MNGDDRDPSPVERLVSAGVLGDDPLPWVLASDEPWARWIALTEVLGTPPEEPSAVAVRLEIVAHPSIRRLIAELPDPDKAADHGEHGSPLFAPNRLGLLADLGVRAGDDARLDRLAEALLGSRDRQGRLVMPERLPQRPKPEKGSAICDSNAIADALVRLGYARDARLLRALKRLAADSAASRQGRGWRCIPERRPLIDLSARRSDACPQVTLEAARALSWLALDRRPPLAEEAARTLLAFWMRRSEERPYEFGHGYQFKTVKWPPFWYNALSVLEVIARFPGLWRADRADPLERAAIAELAAALVQHNVAPDGRVAPARVYRGFEAFSFGRRGEPSPYATARILAVLCRLVELAGAIAEVDVEHLAHSLPLARRTREAPAPAACPVPQRRAYDPARIVPRVLARHHLAARFEPASIDSIASDLVGLPAQEPATPYLALAARLPAFSPDALDAALDVRRSLVRMRCMRGMLYAVRRDLVEVVHAASARQVVRWARDFVRSRGVSAAAYESLSRRILEETAQQPLTTAELRARLRPSVDLAAVVTLMLAEARLVRCAPRDGRFGRKTTFAPFEQVLPDVVLGRIGEDEARAKLLRAYVRGFGPVSVRDAAWWTGMDAKRVGRAFEALEDELVEIAFRGLDGTWLMHVADAEELERASMPPGPTVSLLPASDPLIMSYTDRSRFLDDAARPFVFDAARNVTSVVLVDGRVAGVWDVSDDGEPRVLIHYLRELDSATRTVVEAEARRVGAIRLQAAIERVELVPSMRPLPERPIGAYRHPLR